MPRLGAVGIPGLQDGEGVKMQAVTRIGVISATP